MAKRCFTRALVMICVVGSSLLCGPSSETWSMLTKPMTCQTLLPMHAALFAQWAWSLVFSGLIFVPLLSGWIISTVFRLGWLEVSLVCYSSLAGPTSMNVFSFKCPLHCATNCFGNYTCRIALLWIALGSLSFRICGLLFAFVKVRL